MAKYGGRRLPRHVAIMPIAPSVDAGRLKRFENEADRPRRVTGSFVEARFEKPQVRDV